MALQVSPKHGLLHVSSGGGGECGGGLGGGDGGDGDGDGGGGDGEGGGGEGAGSSWIVPALFGL